MPNKANIIREDGKVTLEGKFEDTNEYFVYDSLEDIPKKEKEYADKITQMSDDAKDAHQRPKGRETSLERENRLSTIQTTYTVNYLPYIKKIMMNAWTMNLNRHLSGEGKSYSPKEVAEGVSEYLQGLHERIEVDAPIDWNKFVPFVTSEEEIAGEDSWLTEWKEEVLANAPKTKVELAKQDIFGEINGKRLSVEQSMAKAIATVNNICENEQRNKENCRDALSVLRAVEEKHETRGFFWKIFNFRKNSLEKRTIELLRTTIENEYEEEMIAEMSTDEAMKLPGLPEDGAAGENAAEKEAAESQVAQAQVKGGEPMEVVEANDEPQAEAGEAVAEAANNNNPVPQP